MSMRLGQAPGGHTEHVSLPRTLFAARLWLSDAVRGRLSVYHWQRRRRRLHGDDLRVPRNGGGGGSTSTIAGSGEAPARSSYPSGSTTEGTFGKRALTIARPLPRQSTSGYIAASSSTSR